MTNTKPENLRGGYNGWSNYRSSKPVKRWRTEPFYLSMEQWWPMPREKLHAKERKRRGHKLYPRLDHQTARGQPNTLNLSLKSGFHWWATKEKGTSCVLSSHRIHSASRCLACLLFLMRGRGSPRRSSSRQNSSCSVMDRVKNSSLGHI